MWMKIAAFVAVFLVAVSEARFPGDGADSLDDLLHLEQQPFMLPIGVAYRDMLTIGASQAVGKFAGNYQPEERQKIDNRHAELRRQQRLKAMDVKYYSSTLAQPVGRPDVQNGLDYNFSRRVRLAPALRQDRALADQDEIALLELRDQENHEAARTGGSNAGRGRLPLRGRNLSNRNRRPTARPNFQSFSSAPLRALPTLAPTTRYTTTYAPAIVHPPLTHAPAYHHHALLTPFNFPTAAPALPAGYPSPSPLPGNPTVDYNIEVTHGSGSGSYSYSTFGR